MEVENSCVGERKSVNNKEIKYNNDGCNNVDEEGRGSFADNYYGNNLTVTKMALLDMSFNDEGGKD